MSAVAWVFLVMLGWTYGAYGASWPSVLVGAIAGGLCFAWLEGRP